MLLEEYGGECCQSSVDILEPWKLAFDFINGAFYLLHRAAAAMQIRKRLGQSARATIETPFSLEHHFESRRVP